MGMLAARLSAALLACTVAASLLAPPALGASPTLPPSSADRARADTARDSVAAAMRTDARDRADREPSSSTPREPGASELSPMTTQPQASGFAAEYIDVCDDAGSAPIDLRESAVVDRESNGDLELWHSACEPWSSDELGDGEVITFIYADDNTSGSPDYAAVIFRENDGSLRVAVYDLGSDGPIMTHAGAALRPDDPDRTVVAPVPADAIGGLERFAFYVSYYASADGGPTDEMPDEDAGLVFYPESCRLVTFDRAAVRTEQGRFDEAVAAAEADGLTVTARSRDAGTFEARGLRGDAAARRRLAAIPGVADVDDVSFYSRAAVTPDDPAYSDQWALRAVGAPDAWSVRTGSDLRVAIIDDGVDAGRNDLQGRVAAGRDLVFGQSLDAGANSDLGGHGTAVAGVLGATGNNGREMAGVDWNADIVPLRVSDNAGCISGSAVAAGIDAAVGADVDVINLSLGGIGRSEAMENAVARAVAAEITVVAAVGNDISDFATIYPAAYDGVIGVGATTRDGQVAGYSNQNSSVDVVAPGGDASGTAEGDLLTLGALDTIEPMAGTSFSAPMVAGAALLYRASQVDASDDDVSDALTWTAIERGPTGRDDAYGHGALDLHALLALTEPHTPEARDTASACPDGDVPDAGFDDVFGTHATAIDCVVWWQVANGISDARYGPQRSVTRAQMATFIQKAIVETGGDLPDDPDDAFDDDGGSVHHDAINQLAAAGVVGGVGGGRYAPDSTVNRAQMATFLAQAAEHRLERPLASAIDFFDDDDGNVHEPRIDDAAEAGLTGGSGSGGYDPAAAVRRDQMASFLARLLALTVDRDDATLPDA